MHYFSLFKRHIFVFKHLVCLCVRLFPSAITQESLPMRSLSVQDQLMPTFSPAITDGKVFQQPGRGIPRSSARFPLTIMLVAFVQVKHSRVRRKTPIAKVNNQMSSGNCDAMHDRLPCGMRISIINRSINIVHIIYTLSTLYTNFKKSVVALPLYAKRQARELQLRLSHSYVCWGEGLAFYLSLSKVISQESPCDR